MKEFSEKIEETQKLIEDAQVNLRKMIELKEQEIELLEQMERYLEEKINMESGEY